MEWGRNEIFGIVTLKRMNDLGYVCMQAFKLSIPPPIYFISWNRKYARGDRTDNY